MSAFASAVEWCRRRAHRFLELGLHDPEHGRYDRTPFGRGTVHTILDVPCPTCKGGAG